MMNKILFFFLISLNGFSQKIGSLEFSISEIDSLSKMESCLVIHDFGGKIDAEKTYNLEKLKTIGTGYTSIKTHSYFNDSFKYDKLTSNEKRYYDNSTTCKFIRADFSSIINYDNGTYEKIVVLFYYNNKELFYIKYRKEVKENNKSPDSIYHNFFYADISNELSKEDDLKKWIQDENEEIIKKIMMR